MADSGDVPVIVLRTSVFPQSLDFRPVIFLTRLLRVQVGSEVLPADGRCDAAVGDRDSGDPQQGVQNNFAVIVVPPVGVKMPAGKTESTSSIFAFHRPQHGF